MRHVGKVAFWSAFGGVLLPLAGGAATAVGVRAAAVLAGHLHRHDPDGDQRQHLGADADGARRAAIARRSTILAAAVIDDVMGIVVLSIVVALARRRSRRRCDGPGAGSSCLRLARVLCGGDLCRAAGCRRCWAGRADLPVSQALLAAVLVIAFVYGWAAEYVGGVAAITGTYLAGVLVAQTRVQARQIDAGVHPLTYSMFVPVFFISIGLQADARALAGQAAFTVTLVVVAIVAKAVGCGSSRACAASIPASRSGSASA